MPSRLGIADINDNLNDKLIEGMPAHMTAVFEPIADWGLIRATGPQARQFLHAQLTQNVETLIGDEIRRAAYCTPKGRVLGDFLLFAESGDDVGLVTPRSLVGPLIKRLSMYILRLQCRLLDACADTVIVYLEGVREPLQRTIENTVHQGSGRSLSLTPDRLLIVPLALWTEVRHLLVAAGCTESLGSFSQRELQQGYAHITQQTVEQFIPQTLDYDLTGAVSFDKGCYPGQEIVARAHYLGKQKRRLVAGRLRQNIATLIAPGDDVYLAAEPDQPIGRIVNVVATPTQSDILFEMPLDRLLAGELLAGSPQGPAIEALRIAHPNAHEG
ncbi:MAG: YgfZ/GcvT domain-containing protein [Burkholderiaceae bacterium]|jgi:folate-binding protein YgfZ